MRIATLIIGLLLMLPLGLQSCAVSVGDAMFAEEGASDGGAVGLLIALLFLVGAAFAIAFPLVSLISFAAAGLLGLIAGATTSFGDLTIWGIAALVLAVLSFFGMREKKRKSEESRSRVT